jgi:hypothetical protein
MELFNLLSKTCNFVQVYGGDLDPICEYNNRKWGSREMEIEYEYDVFGVNTKNSFNTPPN